MQNVQNADMQNAKRKFAAHVVPRDGDPPLGSQLGAKTLMKHMTHRGGKS
jgi:hypothetical protein